MGSGLRPPSLLLGAVAIASCSIFPDQAALPSSGDAGTTSVIPTSAGSATTSGGAGQPTTFGGSAGSGETAGEATSAGGEPLVALGGAPPATGGAAGCDARQSVSVAVDADSWIDLAEPAQNHGADNRLNVVSGATERRALIRVTLPAALEGAILDKATFTLQLARNKAADDGARQLAMHRLKRQFVGDAVGWTSADAALAWEAPGGDLGVELARSTVPLGVMDGAVVFDLSSRLGRVANAAERTISFVVLELPSEPAPTAQLLFGSSEAGAALRPVLTLEYCAP